jgi:hypothetical protein
MNTTTGQPIRPSLITRTMVRAQPGTLFAVGDNMQRRGHGGQAAAMRGEPNAIGIPTKWAPRTGPDAFFQDSDWNRTEVRAAINSAFCKLAAALLAGRTVAVPADGLGTGRAELHARAPQIAAAIAARLARLEALATSNTARQPAATTIQSRYRQPQYITPEREYR